MDQGPSEEQRWASNPASEPGGENTQEPDYKHEETQPKPRQLERHERDQTVRVTNPVPHPVPIRPGDETAPEHLCPLILGSSCISSGRG